MYKCIAILGAGLVVLDVAEVEGEEGEVAVGVACGLGDPGPPQLVVVVFDGVGTLEVGAGLLPDDPALLEEGVGGVEGFLVELHGSGLRGAHQLFANDIITQIIQCEIMSSDYKTHYCNYEITYICCGLGWPMRNSVLANSCLLLLQASGGMNQW